MADLRFPATQLLSSNQIEASLLNRLSYRVRLFDGGRRRTPVDACGGPMLRNIRDHMSKKYMTQDLCFSDRRTRVTNCIVAYPSSSSFASPRTRSFTSIALFAVDRRRSQYEQLLSFSGRRHLPNRGVTRFSCTRCPSATRTFPACIAARYCTPYPNETHTFPEYISAW